MSCRYFDNYVTRLLIKALIYIFLCAFPALVKATNSDTNNNLEKITQISISTAMGSYYHRLLELAMLKTQSEYGACEIQLKSQMIIGNRMFRAVERGDLDVIWWPYKKNIAYDVTPITIRMFKNLSDYRVLLIRKGDQEKFNQVKSIGDLRKLKGGIGSNWPDRDIMEKNQLDLFVHVNYVNLFKMLAAKRFDYYSRGLHQVFQEINQYQSMGIELEQSLLLHYENPVYFYVSAKNTRLAERIAKGLAIAMEDGSFENLFQQYEHIRWAEQFINQHQRVVIHLPD